MWFSWQQSCNRGFLPNRSQHEVRGKSSSWNIPNILKNLFCSHKGCLRVLSNYEDDRFSQLRSIARTTRFQKDLGQVSTLRGDFLLCPRHELRMLGKAYFEATRYVSKRCQKTRMIARVIFPRDPAQIGSKPVPDFAESVRIRVSRIARNLECATA